MNLKNIKEYIKSSLKNFKAIMKERWIYYAFGYLFGYVLVLIEDGVNPKNLFPIKIMAIILSMFVGNGAYYSFARKLTRAEAQEKGFKYTIGMLLIFLITALFQKLILAVFGFDIYLFI